MVTPKGFRLHIGIFGRRNVGKSSLLNAITRQAVSIVSEHAGTTTDPVEKAMELLPLGPVLWIDTGGIDDEGDLGKLRVEKTEQAFERTDVGILVLDQVWGNFEELIVREFTSRNIPYVVVSNKSDKGRLNSEIVSNLQKQNIPVVFMTANQGMGVFELRQALIDIAPSEFLESPVILRDLVPFQTCAVLVIPIDKEAPKGRIILPQVQAIRDCLENQALCMVTQDTTLSKALKELRNPPAIVVTDSQAFLAVARDTPSHIPLTSFSILFSRLKGDLISQTQGVKAVDSLKPGNRVLIAEACTHHPISDDIRRDKLPRWLDQKAKGPLQITVVQGKEFPQDVSPYHIVIHCGACVWNRRSMLSRILQCKKQNVPITNYGLVIAHCLGILERALGPFPEALEVYRVG